LIKLKIDEIPHPHIGGFGMTWKLGVVKEELVILPTGSPILPPLIKNGLSFRMKYRFIGMK
jgi:hypothetical protein